MEDQTNTIYVPAEGSINFFTLLLLLSAAVLLLIIFTSPFIPERIYQDFQGQEPQTFSQRIIELNNGSFKDATTGGPLSEEDLQTNFLEPLSYANSYKDENKSREEGRKFSKYSTVYQSLVGQYYATHDPRTFELAKEIRAYIKLNFSEYYLSFEEGVPDAWMIVE